MIKRIKLTVAIFFALVIISVSVYFMFVHNDGYAVLKNIDQSVKIIDPIWAAEDKILYFSSGIKGDSLSLFDLSTLETTPILQKKIGLYTTCSNGQRILTRMGKEFLWLDIDVNTATVTKSIQINREDFYVMSMSPSGKFIVGAVLHENTDTMYKILNTETNAYSTIDNFTMQKEVRGWISIFDDGGIVYVNTNQELRIRSFESNFEQKVLTLNEKYSMPVMITISPDNDLVALGSRTGIAIVDFNQEDIKYFDYKPGYRVEDFKWSSDSKYLVTSSVQPDEDKKHILLLDIDSSSLRSVVSHKGVTSFLGFDISPDSSKIVYDLGFNQLRVYDLNL